MGTFTRNYSLRDHNMPAGRSAITSRKDIEFLAAVATNDTSGAGVQVTRTEAGFEVLAEYPWTLTNWLLLRRWRAERALRKVLRHETTLLPAWLAKYMVVNTVKLQWRY